MSANITQSLGLLITGMVTVFLILGLVVATGRLLIKAVNLHHLRTARRQQKLTRPADRSAVPPEIIAVLSAAVNVATSGQGRIKTVERSSKP